MHLTAIKSLVLAHSVEGALPKNFVSVLHISHGWPWKQVGQGWSLIFLLVSSFPFLGIAPMRNILKYSLTPNVTASLFRIELLETPWTMYATRFTPLKFWFSQPVSQFHWCKRASWPVTLQMSRSCTSTKTDLHNKALQNCYCYCNHFTALFILSGTTWVSQYQKVKTRNVKPIWIYWNKIYWVAMASAGLNANLHLIPDTWKRQHPNTQFCWMPFLPPNQQRQRTEGTKGLQN